MERIRSQFDRFSNAVQNLLTTLGPDAVEGPWTIHEANLAVYSALTQSSSRNPSRLALPPEIVLQILDDPSRSILTSYVHVEFPPDKVPFRIRSQSSPFTVLSLLPVTAKTVRKVVFEIKGKDQGWSSYSADHKTFNNTWSWYEAVKRGKERDENEKLVEVSRFEIQRNRHAGQEPETYRIEFGQDSDLVKGLEEGEQIELDACAAFPGWECNVYAARIEIWNVDDLTLGEEMEWVEKEKNHRRMGQWVDKKQAEEMRAEVENHE